MITYSHEAVVDGEENIVEAVWLMLVDGVEVAEVRYGSDGAGRALYPGRVEAVSFVDGTIYGEVAAFLNGEVVPFGDLHDEIVSEGYIDFRGDEWCMLR